MTFVEGLQIWQAYRGKIVAEDNLINHRMSWMLWSEAILYAMWGALVAASNVKNDTLHEVRLSLIYCAMLLISVVGVAVGYWSKTSIQAAKSELKGVKEEYARKFPEMYASGSGYPYIFAQKDVHLLGHSVADHLPTCFMIMQSLTFVYVLFLATLEFLPMAVFH